MMQTARKRHASYEIIYRYSRTRSKGRPFSISYLTAAKNERRVDIAKREALIIALLTQLKPTLEATLRRSERRETQTLKEREKEMEEDLHGSEVEGPKK